MRKLRNILLIVVTVLVMCGPGLIAAAEKADVRLPVWMTAGDARYLSGGIANPKLAQHLNLKGFTGKTLQTAMSDEVEDHIPFKASVMLGNSALQRVGIEVANVVFGWPAYPTHYGSSIFYVPSMDVVYRGPQGISDEHDRTLCQFVSNLRGFAERHPDKRFFIYFIYSEVDPAGTFDSSLKNNIMNPTARTQMVAEEVEGVQNLTLLTHVYPTQESLYEDFFKTDHHWNWRGAMRAYGIIADAAGLAPAPECEGVEVEGPRFVGSLSREGLMEVDEPISDSGIDFSNLQVLMSDGSLESYSHDKYEKSNERYKRYGFYGSYYDFLTNADTIYGPGEGGALVLTSSHGSAILPLIAENYAETHVSQQFRDSLTDPDARLESMLEQTGAQDIYIISKPVSYQHSIDLCPDFFE